MRPTRICTSLAAIGLMSVSLLGQERVRMPQPVGESGGGRVTPGGGNLGRTSSPDRHDSPRTSAAPGTISSHHGALAGNRTNHWGANKYYWHPWPISPTREWWEQRNIMSEIQYMSRDGFIECTRVADDATGLNDFANFPSGWKGYAFVVPPNGTLHVRLHHMNEGWFRLLMVNKWGGLEKGMLQNVIPTGNPEVTYINPRNEPQAVYVIADDPGWMSSKAYPYQLQVDRSWDPAAVKLGDVKVANGIWANQNDVSAQFRRPTRSGIGVGIRGWW